MGLRLSEKSVSNWDWLVNGKEFLWMMVGKGSGSLTCGWSDSKVEVTDAQGLDRLPIVSEQISLEAAEMLPCLVM